MTPSSLVGETVSSGHSIEHHSQSSGRLRTLTGVQSLHSMWMPTTSCQEDKMEPSEYGLELTVNFWFSSMVSTWLINLIIFVGVDQKKDIVSLFPDVNKPHLIHSCSMDRTISTYDLKQEKRLVGHSVQNGALYGMSQRKDNEFELVTCGQGAPIYFWDCDETRPVA